MTDPRDNQSYSHPYGVTKTLYTHKRRIDKQEMVQGILQRMPREIPKRMLR